MSIKPPPDDFTFGDARDSVRDRAIAAGIEWWLEDWSSSDEDPDPFLLGLALPNGNRKRRISLDGDDARKLAKVRFENFVVVGDYRAILDTESNSVEVLLEGARGRGVGVRTILGLPGSEVYRRIQDSDQLEKLSGGLDDVEPAGSMSALSRVRRGHEFTWRLPFSELPDGLAIEISPASDSFLAIAGSNASGIRRSSQPTLKISTNELNSHDSALGIMEDYASSILFDLDTRFELPLSMERIRWLSTPLQPYRDFRSEHAVRFPACRYSSEATTLYFYAKAATTMPLLQYLSYYQSIENHFARFFEAATTQRIRNQLKDPRFDISSDAAIKRLIATASRGGRGSASERDQLKATIHGSVEVDEIVDFLEMDAERKAALTRKGEIEGAPWIGKARDSLLDHLGERIYYIRCRIVHSKEDASDEHAAPLMPYSRESAKLSHDLELIEFVARRVIIAGATPR